MGRGGGVDARRVFLPRCQAQGSQGRVRSRTDTSRFCRDADEEWEPVHVCERRLYMHACMHAHVWMCVFLQHNMRAATAFQRISVQPLKSRGGGGAYRGK